MTNKYINFYNNLVKLTRNKKLYSDFNVHDTFSERLIILMFHFAFFLNVFKNDSNKKTLQEIFDFFFKQLEFSLREIGYGDSTVNKRMKNYVNIFYSILESIDNWHTKNQKKKIEVISQYIKLNKNSFLLLEYFIKYRKYLENNTLNSLIKGVSNLDF